jgi:hypothetical protein
VSSSAAGDGPFLVYILRTMCDDPGVVSQERKLSLIPFPMEEVFDTKPPSGQGGAGTGRGEPPASGSREGGDEEGEDTAAGPGRAAASHLRAVRVRLSPLWRQAQGAGVRDGSARGALHCAAPGTAHAAWEAGPDTGATSDVTS